MKRRRKRGDMDTKKRDDEGDTYRDDDGGKGEG